MNSIIIFFLSVIIIGLLIGFIAYFVAFINQKNGPEFITLSFNEFRQYYTLNPKSWKVDYNDLRKRSENYNNYLCRIKFSSYWQYIIFVYFKKKNIILEESNKEYTKFLEEIQLDIDRFQK